MPEEVAVELGLAVLVVAEGDVELGDRLSREDRLQEPDDPGRRLHVDVEVGAGEAEDDRDVVLVEEDGVDRDPAVRVHEGENERQEPLVADDPPDDVRPLVAIEDRLEELDEVEGRVAPGGGERLVDDPAHERGFSVGIRPGDPEGVVVENLPDDGAGRHGPGVGPHGNGARRGKAGVAPEVDELPLRVDAHRREDLPRDRVEERLRQLEVSVPAHQPGVLPLHRRPEIRRPARLAEDLLERPHDAADDVRVERQPLHHVLLDAVPVGGLEVEGRTTREPTKARPVLLEAPLHEDRALAGDEAVGFDHAARRIRQAGSVPCRSPGTVPTFAPRTIAAGTR